MSAYYPLPTMVDALGVYLNEINQAQDAPDEFPKELRVYLLNQAQNKVVHLIEHGLLTGLQITTSALSLTAPGKYDLTELSPVILGRTKGIFGVTHKDGKYCRLVSFDEFMQYTNADFTFLTSDPIMYFLGDEIQIRPFAASDTCVINYIQEPFKMYWNVASGSIVADVEYYNNGYTKVTYDEVEYTNGQTFTGVTGETTYTATGTGFVAANCMFGLTIQEIILDMAASIGFKIGGRANRSLTAYNDAITGIEALNLTNKESKEEEKRE